MKTSDTMAWECKIFTQKFLGFRDEYNVVMKLKSINNIFIPQHNETERKFLIQIWYKTTSRLKPNPWKLVIQEHGNASLSYMYLWCFELHRIWKWDYRAIHHIPNLGNYISSAKCKHHSNKWAINMRVWGNEEEGMR